MSYDALHEVLLVILIYADGSWYISELVTRDTDDCEEAASHMRSNKISATTLYICATAQRKRDRGDNL